MSPPDPPSGGRRRRLLPLVVLGISVGGIGIGGGLYGWQAERIDDALQTMAHERARALFDLTSLAWDWNVRHQAGGIPPELPINPARMVREIGDLARPEGLRLSVTSLVPLDPANAPDAWEAESLRLINEGRMSERLSFFPGSEPVYRFMAPVPAKASCTTCHGDQGQKGGVMGGDLHYHAGPRAAGGRDSAQKKRPPCCWGGELSGL
ncbi:c-type heme family protein [Pararhodospirillum photometricum]|uniref:Predicted signal transduction protein containing a membrane domain n=1 Tax=Pararhodospirillum photometricum DSM 122 TaxID=1150469 RepID=H6SK79_PARPM|nr:DUF3365 domain-containing protein [Pararhodospirillum photometricum]CCG08394.1 Predicted signal transduction protein containing a membrane domain [Pararhodospirillum photometricum DSM 122]